MALCRLTVAGLLLFDMASLTRAAESVICRCQLVSGRQKKADASGIGFWKFRTASLKSSHCTQSVVQSAFAASGFIFVNQTFVNGGIDNRNGAFKGGLCLFLVASSDSGNNFLNKGAEVAALSGIANTAFLCLARSFFSLW